MKFNFFINIGVILLLFLIVGPMINADTYNDCSVYGNCKRPIISPSSSSGSSYNSTYNNLLNQNCPNGQVVNGTYQNGTFKCVTVSSSMNHTNLALTNQTNTFQNNQNFNGTIKPNLTTSMAGYQDIRTINSTITAGTVFYSYPTLSGNYSVNSLSGLFGADIGFQDERRIRSTAVSSLTESGTFGIRMSVFRSSVFNGSFNGYRLYGLFSNLVDAGKYYVPTSTISKASNFISTASGGTVSIAPTINVGATNTASYTTYGQDYAITYNPTLTSGILTSSINGMRYSITAIGSGVTGDKDTTARGFITDVKNLRSIDEDAGGERISYTYGLDLQTTQSGNFMGDEGYYTTGNIGGSSFVTTNGTWNNTGTVDQSTLGFDFITTSNPRVNNADLIATTNTYGVRGVVAEGGNESNGILYASAYAGQFFLNGFGTVPTNGYRNGYGLYVEANNAADWTEVWGFYASIASGVNNYLGADNSKTFFGSSKDMSIYYNGSDAIIKANEVGTGKVYLEDNVVITGNLSVKRPYGMFSDNTTQVIGVADTAQIINFSTIEDNYLINLEGKQNISVLQSGDYYIDVSAIFNVDLPNKHIELWLQKTNSSGQFVNVPRSNTKMELPSATVEIPLAVSFIVDLLPTEKIRFMTASDDAGSSIVYTTNTSYSPETPSIKINMHKISEITP